MANLNISVNNDLYTITLDQFEWTSLSVNGVAVTASAGGFSYSQTTPGSLMFVAQATQIVAVNPDDVMFLADQPPLTAVHVATLNYSAPSSGTFQINGHVINLSNWDETIKIHFTGKPFQFSQGLMTGEFNFSS